MDDEEVQLAPPVIEPPPRRVARWRWWIHLLVLGPFPLVFGIIGAAQSSQVKQQPIIPTTSGALVLLVAIELASFLVLFAVAWAASRANVDQLMLRWKDGIKPIWRGFAYSIALRLGIAAVVVLLLLVTLAVSGGDKSVVESMRPKVENVIDPESLQNSPLFLILNLTLVSFVLGGFREELWRAGMLAGFAALFPETFRKRSGRVLFVLVAAVIFGLGHLPQGWSGVLVTAILGVGLGLIMLWHGSIWDAVLAHGFFDAATFAALFLAGHYFPDVLKQGFALGL